MVDYTHAGTVEYLFLEETGEFFFLELNPRLQVTQHTHHVPCTVQHAPCPVHRAPCPVRRAPCAAPCTMPRTRSRPLRQVEHPVTEGITGANIPSLQLIVAMGIDITRLPPAMEINKFVVDVNKPSTDNPFERVNGHTIAVRITAENAADGWKPTVGAIEEISFQSLPSVWGYFSVKTPAAEVHAYADSQFGHVFAHGKDRRSAARLLQLALKRLRVVGEICTNVPYVAELIATEDFVENRVNTGWLDKLIEARMQLPPPDL